MRLSARVAVLTAVLAACSVALATPGLAQVPPFIAIRDARIVTGAGAVIESGTVVLERGLITAVGAKATIPDDAEVLDGRGLTVYPGLFDALSDLGAIPPAAAARGGAAQAAPPPRPPARGPADRPGSTPWVEVAHDWSPDARRVETWRNGGFTTAHVAPSGGTLPGQGAVVSLSGTSAADTVVKSPVSLAISLQPIRGGYPGSLMGVVSYLRQVFLDADHYAKTAVVYEADPRGRTRPEYDRTVVALAESVRAARPTLLPAVSPTQIQRLLDLAAELGLKPVVVGAHAGYDAADRLKAAGAAVLVGTKWPEAERDADPDADEPLRTLRFRDRAPSTPARLHESGVPFAFSSNGLATPRDVLRNVRRAVDAGLPHEAAIRALTLGPAEIFGVADRLGSIDPGKIANLVITDGDLLDEGTKVKTVFVDGRRFDVPESPAPGESRGAREEP